MTEPGPNRTAELPDPDDGTWAPRFREGLRREGGCEELRAGAAAVADAERLWIVDGTLFAARTAQADEAGAVSGEL